jgi:hypothetical protein
MPDYEWESDEPVSANSGLPWDVQAIMNSLHQQGTISLQNAKDLRDHYERADDNDRQKIMAEWQRVTQDNDRIAVDREKIMEAARQFNIGNETDLFKFAHSLALDYDKLKVDAGSAILNAPRGPADFFAYAARVKGLVNGDFGELGKQLTKGIEWASGKTLAELASKEPMSNTEFAQSIMNMAKSKTPDQGLLANVTTGNSAAINQAREQLAKLDGSWANASDQAIMDKVRSDPTLFNEPNNPIRKALMAMPATGLSTQMQNNKPAAPGGKAFVPSPSSTRSTRPVSKAAGGPAYGFNPGLGRPNTPEEYAAAMQKGRMVPVDMTQNTSWVKDGGIDSKYQHPDFGNFKFGDGDYGEADLAASDARIAAATQRAQEGGYIGQRGPETPDGYFYVNDQGGWTWRDTTGLPGGTWENGAWQNLGDISSWAGQEGIVNQHQQGMGSSDTIQGDPGDYFGGDSGIEEGYQEGGYTFNGGDAGDESNWSQNEEEEDYSSKTGDIYLKGKSKKITIHPPEAVVRLDGKSPGFLADLARMASGKTPPLIRKKKGYQDGGIIPAVYNWSDSSRGLAEPDRMYSQVLTPVNMNDPSEVLRWNQMNPTNQINSRPRRPIPPMAPTTPIPISRTGFTSRGQEYNRMTPTLQQLLISQNQENGGDVPNDFIHGLKLAMPTGFRSAPRPRVFR